MSNNLNQEGRELLIHNLKEEKEVENKKPEDEKEGELYNIQRNLNEDSTYDKSIKVILLGDSMVGKSSVINRLCNQTFDESIGPTICIEHYNYLIKVNDYTIRMQIWDTAGQEKYNSIINKYYANTDLAIYVYSIDNLESFHRIKDWMLCCEEKNAEKENNETKNILLGNKKDFKCRAIFESPFAITFNVRWQFYRFHTRAAAARFVTNLIDRIYFPINENRTWKRNNIGTSFVFHQSSHFVALV